MSTNIKFPEEHYVGMITSRGANDGKDELPLAFLTPEGTDAAAIKRKGTVDNWVQNNNRGKGKSLPAVTIKNEAIGGFRLLEDVRNYGWGSGNVKWRVEDPRGFELEISSPNLMNILACSVVDCGEILDRCLWARQGSENVLVPVTSETYKQAVENTARMNKSASLKDLKPGDHVILQNGIKGRYYGKFHTVELGWSKVDDGLRISKTKKYIIVEDVPATLTSEACKVAHDIAAPKLSEIIPDTELSPRDGMRMLNEMQGIDWFSLNHDVKMVLTKTVGELPESYSSKVCVAELNGEYWEVNFDSHSAKHYKLSKINTHQWVQHTRIEYIESMRSYSFIRSNSLNLKEFDEADFAGIPLYGRTREMVFDDGMVHLLQY